MLFLQMPSLSLHVYLQCGRVLRYFATDGRLNVHHVVVPEQVPELLLIIVDHLDYPAGRHVTSRNIYHLG